MIVSFFHDNYLIYYTNIYINSESSSFFLYLRYLERVFSKNSGICDNILYSLTPIGLLISFNANSAVTFFLSLQSNISNVGLSLLSLIYLSTTLKYKLSLSAYSSLNSVVFHIIYLIFDEL